MVTLSCSTKSQCASIPAISTTRLSWISPQRPRTAGARSAFTRFAVSDWSRPCVSIRDRICSDSVASAANRAFSSSPIFESTR